MIRLYDKDLCRLKEGQKLWVVTIQNGKHTRIPCKYEGAYSVTTHGSRGIYQHFYAAIYTYDTQSLRPFVVRKLYKHADHPNTWRLKRLLTKNSDTYLAKVTKREEAEFFTEIISG